jgi:hypothetical protein
MLDNQKSDILDSPEQHPMQMWKITDDREKNHFNPESVNIKEQKNGRNIQG